MKKTQNRAPNLANLKTEFKYLIFVVIIKLSKKKKIIPSFQANIFFFIHIIKVKYYNSYIISVVSLKGSFENDVVYLLGYSLHLNILIKTYYSQQIINLFCVYDITHIFFY